MSESSCVEQSLFHVALLALVMPDEVQCEFPHQCPEPSCNRCQHKALMGREGHRFLLIAVFHVSDYFWRGKEEAPWAVFLTSWEDTIRSQFGDGHLGPLDGWPGGEDRGMWSSLEVVWEWKYQALSCVRLFATPWTVAHQAPQSTGFSRPEYWSGLPFPSPGDLPNPRIEPRSPALAGGFFNNWATSCSDTPDMTR